MNEQNIGWMPAGGQVPQYNQSTTLPINQTIPQQNQIRMPYVPQPMGIDTVAQVSGRAGAESYPVGAGHTAVLIDFPGGLMWVKATDIRGVLLPLEEYAISLVPQVQQPTEIQNGNYVSKAEFNELLGMVATLVKNQQDAQVTTVETDGGSQNSYQRQPKSSYNKKS